MVDILVPGENRDYYMVNLDISSLRKISQELYYWPERYAELLRDETKNISDLNNYGASFKRECKFYGEETIADGLYMFFDVAVSAAEKRGFDKVLVQDLVVENGSGCGSVSGLIQLLC